MSAESQITALGISLPDAPKPGGVGFVASQLKNWKFLLKLICSAPAESYNCRGVRASSDSGRHDPCVRTCALAGGGRIHSGIHPLLL